MAEPLKRLFTRDEYYAMAEAGILKPEDRVELIEGEIYRMAPIGNPHAGCVNRLVRRFSVLTAADRAVLSPQNPVNLTDISEPQPDVTLLRPREDFYGDGHPTPEDVLLLVEVADSSIGFDRHTKIPLYALCGISEVWQVDINKEAVEIYREPSREGYRSVQRFRRGDQVAPQAFPDFEIAVESILP
ncbi:MAG TPA: Uma2 family endonuclease [Thermoanaerobaculia bacterium]|nr:Uma2 family endonuclease [Thermoanaerobaculia bacterium]